MEHRGRALIALYEQKARSTAELAQLCTQRASKTTETTDPESGMTKNERFDKRAKADRGSESVILALLTFANSAILAKCDTCKSRLEVLRRHQQCMPGLAEEANSYMPRLPIWKTETLLRRTLL